MTITEWLLVKVVDHLNVATSDVIFYAATVYNILTSVNDYYLLIPNTACPIIVSPQIIATELSYYINRYHYQ